MNEFIDSKEEKNPFPIEFCKISVIRHILNGTLECSGLFFSYISPEESLNIIQSLFVSDPPSIFKLTKNIPTTQHYRWMLSCLISYFTSQIPSRKMFVLPIHYFNVPKRFELSTYNTATSNSINKLIFNPSIRTTQEQQIKLAKLLLRLYDENRPLFEWIIGYYEVNKYIRNIPLSAFYSKFNYRFFKLYTYEMITNHRKESSESLFNDSDLKEMPFQIKEKDEIENFFSIYANLIEGKPINYFQKDFFKEHPYPYVYPYSEDDKDSEKNIFSLLHTTISNCQFFVDVVRKNISEILIQAQENLKGGNSEIAKSNLSRLRDSVCNAAVIGEMQSWVFLSLFPNILNNYENFYEQIECVTLSCENIASDLLLRLKNDRILFNHIHDWTGKIIRLSEFSTKSIPFEVYDYIRNMDSQTVDSLIKSKPLLCLSDTDREKDSNFLNGYFAISKALKTISIDQDFDVIEPIADQLGKCIDSIISADAKSSIIIDIFSLLFMTGKDGKFVFQSLSMQTVLQVLINNANEQILPYLNNGLIHIQLHQQTAKDLDILNDLFISSKNKLLKALLNKNMVFAENLAKTSHENQMLFNHYKLINDFISQNGSLNLNENENSSSDFLPIEEKPIDEIEEFALAVEGQNNLFDRIRKESSLPEVKELANVCDYSKPFKLFKVLSKKKIEFLKEKLNNKNGSEWKIPTFVISSDLDSNNQQIVFNDPSKLNDLKLLKGFFEYLDLLIPTLLSPGQTIEDALNKNVDEIIDQFLAKEEFEKAGKLSTKMDVDIRKKVLSSLKYHRNCYEHYCDGLKPVLTTVALFGNWKDCFQELNPNESSQKVLLKLFSKDENLRNLFLKQNEIVFPENLSINDKIEFDDRFKQGGFVVSKQDLSDALENDQQELFVDLSYRSSTEVVEQVLSDHLNNDTIEKLIDWINLCPVSAEFINKYQLLFDMHKKYSYNISNISQIFIDLLSSRKFIEAKKFYEVFIDYKDEFDNEIRKTVNEYVENSSPIDLRITIVAPSMRKEILNLVQKVKMEEQEVLFESLIPSSWIYMNDFKETVKANIENDPNGAIEILEKFKLLNCDEIIIEYLNQSLVQNDELDPLDKVHLLRQESSQFCAVIRDLSLLHQFLQKNLYEILLEITVDSEDKEIHLNLYLNRMIKFLNSKMFSKPIQNQRIISIFNICSQYFNMKFNFVYEFNRIDKIVHFCIEKGYYAIVNDLVDVFNVDITEKAFELYLNQFRLFEYGKDPVLAFSLRANNLPEEVKSEICQKCSTDFSYFASCQPEFSGNLIRTVETSFEKNDVNNVCEKIIDDQQPFLNDYKEGSSFCLNERQAEILKFFTEQSDISIACKYYSVDIEKGFSIMELQLDEAERKSGFVSLFESSISHSKMNVFMKYLGEFDPDNSKYSPFLLSLNESCSSVDYPFLKLCISRIIGDLLTTSRMSLKIYTFKPDLSYLDIAESSLNDLKKSIKMCTKEILSVRDSNSAEKKVHICPGVCMNVELIPSVLANIDRALKKISLQRRFVVFCFERNLTGFDSLNLFCGDATIGSIVTLLFKNSEFKLSFDILSTLNQQDPYCLPDSQIEPTYTKIGEKRKNWLNNQKPPEFEEILRGAAFSLGNDGFEAVLKFIQAMQENLKNEEEFEKIIYSFIKEYKLPPFEETDWVKQIALNVIRNMEFKVRILIEIDEFEIAADFATDKRNKLEHLIPLIANLSFHRYNMNAFYKCMRALESNTM